VAVVIAVILAVLGYIAKKADMKFIARCLGVAAFLIFIGWLASGPGGAIADWFKDPSVDLPSVDINQITQ
jgi:hypothetical protein